MYLQAGQVHVASEPCEIVTVLGSCVSVCLFDGAGVGGMNHFLLPLGTGREASPRFGAHAMRALLDGALAAGARRARLEAKVFGGASVIAAFRERHLGAENASVALRFLEEERIPVSKLDVGGSRGRKLLFHADEGSAWVKLL